MYVREKAGHTAVRSPVWWVIRGPPTEKNATGGSSGLPCGIEPGAHGLLGQLERSQGRRSRAPLRSGRDPGGGGGTRRGAGSDEARGTPGGLWEARDDTQRRVHRAVGTGPLEQIPSEWAYPAGAPFTVQGSVQQGYFYGLAPEFVGQLGSRFRSSDSDTVVYGSLPERPIKNPPSMKSWIAFEESGLAISETMLRRYHLSLKTRGFVILPASAARARRGSPSSTRKAVGAEPLLVPVAPNWTTNEDLLGYLNPISTAVPRHRVQPVSTRGGRGVRAGDAGAADPTAVPPHPRRDEPRAGRVLLRQVPLGDGGARPHGTRADRAGAGHEVLLTPNLMLHRHRQRRRDDPRLRRQGLRPSAADRAPDPAERHSRAPRRASRSSDALIDDLGRRPRGGAVRLPGPRRDRRLRRRGRGTWRPLGAGARRAAAAEGAAEAQGRRSARRTSALRSSSRLTRGRFPAYPRKGHAMHDDFSEHGFASYF